MKLVEGWQKFYKFWSVQLGAIGAAVVSVFVMFPSIAVDTWNNLPADIKSAIPPAYMPLIGVAITVLSLVARFVVQNKLKPVDISNEDAK